MGEDDGLFNTARPVVQEVVDFGDARRDNKPTGRDLALEKKMVDAADKRHRERTGLPLRMDFKAITVDDPQHYIAFTSLFQGGLPCNATLQQAREKARLACWEKLDRVFSSARAKEIEYGKLDMFSAREGSDGRNAANRLCNETHDPAKLICWLQENG